MSRSRVPLVWSGNTQTTLITDPDQAEKIIATASRR